MRLARTTYCMVFKNILSLKIKGKDSRSVVEHLPRMYKALRSVPSRYIHTKKKFISSSIRRLRKEDHKFKASLCNTKQLISKYNFTPKLPNQRRTN